MLRSRRIKSVGAVVVRVVVYLRARAKVGKMSIHTSHFFGRLIRSAGVNFHE